MMPLRLTVLSLAMLICAASDTIAQDMDPRFIDHGVAAPVSRSSGTAAVTDAKGRQLILTWLTDYHGCGNMLVIDIDSGATQQIELTVNKSDSPGTVLHSSDNKFYSHFGHTFYQFDPDALAFTFTQTTADRLGMSMTEDSTGVIWASTYPASHVMSFDPKTKTFKEYGSINTETWPQYPRLMAVDPAGWVYLAIGMTKSQIAALNPATGEVVHVLAEDRRKKGIAIVMLGVDGNVYGRAHTTTSWFKLLEGKMSPIEGDPPAEQPIRTGVQESVFADFGDGRAIAHLDVPERFVDIRSIDGEVRRLEFDYESQGAYFVSIELGPDGRIYGATGHPLRLLAFDPKSGTYEQHGLLGMVGHFNDLAVQRDKVYGALYGHSGGLWEYDPALPWRDTDPQSPNPRQVFTGRADVGRPHALIAHPDGRRLIAVGTPGYGMTGGGMMIYDAQTGEGEMLSHEQLLQHHSALALATLPDGNLVVGSAIYPGTGGETLAKEAELYLFDLAKRQVTFRTVVEPGAAGINDLVVTPDGLVHGMTTAGMYFVLDPEAQTFVHQEKLTAYGPVATAQAPRTMTLTPDGSILVLFQNAIVRIDPNSRKHVKVMTTPVPVHGGIVLLDGRIYFISGSHIVSCDVSSSR